MDGGKPPGEGKCLQRGLVPVVVAGVSPSVPGLMCGQRWPGPALLFALLERGGSRELSLAPAGAVSLLELLSPAKLNWAQEAPGGETCC